MTPSACALAAYRAISDAFAANPAGEHSLTTLMSAAVKLHDRALEEAHAQPTVRGDPFVFDYQPYPPQIRIGPPQEPVQGLGLVGSSDTPAIDQTRFTGTADALERIPVKYPKDWPRGWR